MTRYLLTPTLYSNWRFSYDAPDSCQEQARHDLLMCLRREQRVPTEDQLAGRKFEDDVRAAAEGQYLLPFGAVDSHYDAAVQEIADIVRGGQWQQRCYLDLTFPRHGNFLLFGRMDVVKAPWIFDIKWVANSYEVGRYSKGLQRLSYPASYNCPKFAYLASDGKSVFREDYYYTSDDYEELCERLVEMLDDINRDKELRKLYHEHWGADRWPEREAA